MAQSVLDSVCLAYEPVFDRERGLAAVRLHVRPQLIDAVDAGHLLQAIGEDWPASAPVLILSIEHPRLLHGALQGDPVGNTWLEVPNDLYRGAESLARLAHAVRRGHQLLRVAPLGALRAEAMPPIDTRSLATPSEDEAALLAEPERPGQRRLRMPTGLLMQGVTTRALAAACLEQHGVWGLVGWPDADVLASHRHHAVAYDVGVIREVLEAIDDEECSVEHLERVVRQDAVLVYRILLLVNSAAYGLRREIDSLRHALMMLGLRELGRWLREQLPEGEPDGDLHPVRLSMVMRARLAQHLLATGSDDSLRSEVYTTALLGQLDRLLNRPLGELLTKLPLPGRMFDAVLRRDGPYFPLLDMARALADVAGMERLPALARRHEIPLEQANRALLRMLATSHSHTSRRSERLT